MVDVRASKVLGGNTVWVRVPPPAPNKKHPNGVLFVLRGEDENPPGEIAPAGAFRGQPPYAAALRPRCPTAGTKKQDTPTGCPAFSLLLRGKDGTGTILVLYIVQISRYYAVEEPVNWQVQGFG